jgi:hypothetical protein
MYIQCFHRLEDTTLSSGSNSSSIPTLDHRGLTLTIEHALEVTRGHPRHDGDEYALGDEQHHRDDDEDTEDIIVKRLKPQSMNHHTASHSTLLSNPSLRTLLIPREHHQLLIINMLQLRATQLTQHATKILVHHVKHAQRDVWFGLCSKLVREASGIVALEQACGVEDASGEVGHIDAGEGVGGAEVTADVEEFGLEGEGDVSCGSK